MTSLSDIDRITDHIKGLKERNTILEDALRHVVEAIGPIETVVPVKTIAPEKTKKKKKKKPKVNERYTWCGMQGNYNAYRCNDCNKIHREDRLEKHRCLSIDKEKVNKKRKREEKEDKRPKKKVKEIKGFTRKESSSKKGVVYQCDKCAVIIRVKKSIPSHKCIEEPVIKIEEEDETLFDPSHPRYKGFIDGWEWREYRHNYSCYRCEHCHIVMRHDMIHLHRNCPPLIFSQNNEDIIL